MTKVTANVKQLRILKKEIGGMISTLNEYSENPNEVFILFNNHSNGKNFVNVVFRGD